MATGFLVTTTISGAHPKIADYPLLRDDLLVLDDSRGTYMKESPGIAVGGFVLTEEQRATLREVEFINRGLNYKILD